jgi:hypothetical protein
VWSKKEASPEGTTAASTPLSHLATWNACVPTAEDTASAERTRQPRLPRVRTNISEDGVSVPLVRTSFRPVNTRGTLNYLSGPENMLVSRGGKGKLHAAIWRLTLRVRAGTFGGGFQLLATPRTCLFVVVLVPLHQLPLHWPLVAAAFGVPVLQHPLMKTCSW